MADSFKWKEGASTWDQGYQTTAVHLDGQELENKTDPLLADNDNDNDGDQMDDPGDNYGDGSSE